MSSKTKPKTPEEKFARLAEFLKTGRTAKQIAASYHLNKTATGGVVAAKRLVARAIKAGFEINVVKGTKTGCVGRLPNVYMAP